MRLGLRPKRTFFLKQIAPFILNFILIESPFWSIKIGTVILIHSIKEVIMNPDIFTETFCDWIILYLLYFYVFEILLKSEEVRQSSSKIYDWKEEGR